MGVIQAFLGVVNQIMCPFAFHTTGHRAASYTEIAIPLQTLSMAGVSQAHAELDVFAQTFNVPPKGKG